MCSFLCSFLCSFCVHLRRVQSLRSRVSGVSTDSRFSRKNLLSVTFRFTSTPQVHAFAQRLFVSTSRTPRTMRPATCTVCIPRMTATWLKWGGLREVDLPPLFPRNLGGNVPPKYQGTRRNQNFLGTQGETSVLDQVKSASSCP